MEVWGSVKYRSQHCSNRTNPRKIASAHVVLSVYSHRLTPCYRIPICSISLCGPSSISDNTIGYIVCDYASVSLIGP